MYGKQKKIYYEVSFTSQAKVICLVLFFLPHIFLLLFGALSLIGKADAC